MNKTVLFLGGPCHLEYRVISQDYRDYYVVRLPEISYEINDDLPDELPEHKTRYSLSTLQADGLYVDVMMSDDLMLTPRSEKETREIHRHLANNGTWVDKRGY